MEGVVGGVACAYGYVAAAASAVAGVADVAVQQPPSSQPPSPWASAQDGRASVQPRPVPPSSPPTSPCASQQLQPCFHSPSGLDVMLVEVIGRNGLWKLTLHGSRHLLGLGHGLVVLLRFIALIRDIRG